MQIHKIIQEFIWKRKGIFRKGIFKTILEKENKVGESLYSVSTIIIQLLSLRQCSADRGTDRRVKRKDYRTLVYLVCTLNFDESCKGDSLEERESFQQMVADVHRQKISLEARKTSRWRMPHTAFHMRLSGGSTTQPATLSHLDSGRMRSSENLGPKAGQPLCRTAWQFVTICTYSHPTNR